MANVYLVVRLLHLKRRIIPVLTKNEIIHSLGPPFNYLFNFDLKHFLRMHFRISLRTTCMRLFVFTKYPIGV